MVSSLLLWVVLSAAKAEEPRITIGPGLVTFSEIAAALSTGGRRVEAAPDVADGAAFVCLKDRPWAEARDLLCRGLDLALKPLPEKEATWTLRRDPDVRDREEDWRRRVARNMRNFIVAGAPQAIKLAQMPPEQIKLAEAESKRELDALEAEGKKDSQRYRMLEAEYDRVHSATFWNSQQRLYAAWFAADAPSVGRFQQAAETGWTAWVFPSSRLPASVLAPLIQDQARRNPEARYESAMGVVQLNLVPTDVGSLINLYLVSGDSGFLSIAPPNIGSMSVPFSLIDRQDAERDEWPPWVRWLFEGKRSSEAAAYAGLGGDAVSWLYKQQNATAVFMRSERARAAIPASKPWPRSLSQWVEAWCRKVNGEAVMELCPGGELIEDQDGSRHPNPAYSLAELHRDRLAGAFGFWTFEELKGALLVKNPISFLFRSRKRPAAAMVRLIRKVDSSDEGEKADSGVQAREGVSLNGLPFAVIREYARDVAASPHGYWSFPQAFADRYRGFQLLDLDHAVPAVYAWDRLGAATRKLVIDAALASPGKRESVSLAELGLGDQLAVGRALQAWGHWNWANIVRNPAEWARSEKLVVQVAPADGHPGAFRLRFDFEPTTWGTNCEILWTPP